MSNFPQLLSPLQVGELPLHHRVVLAPLTRMRSTPPGDVPNALNAEYYGQRASDGGLLISEATQISLQGKGYPGAPGIHTAEQVEGWKLVTEAVHAKGGFIFLQLWHVGRISHSSLHPEAGLPVSASAIAPADGAKAMTAQFKQVPFETPRALELDELPGIVAGLPAWRREREGGWLRWRRGAWGERLSAGPVSWRTSPITGRMPMAVRLRIGRGCCWRLWMRRSKFGARGRVGVRLSPYGTFSDMGDSDPVALFTYVLGQLSQRGMAYAHVIEPRATGAGGGAPTNEDAPEDG